MRSRLLCGIDGLSACVIHEFCYLQRGPMIPFEDSTASAAWLPYCFLCVL